jgi:8-oxo-dGTP diphosphatase
MFSDDLENVVLVMKNRPSWQAGKYNGVGGKIEPGEWHYDAMIREFREETGFETNPGDWHEYACLTGTVDGPDDQFTVGFYWCKKSMKEMVEKISTKTDENIYIVDVKYVHQDPSKFIENLPWLIPLAFDNMVDGRPKFVHAEY